MAACHGHDVVAELLLRRGADPNARADEVSLLEGEDCQSACAPVGLLSFAGDCWTAGLESCQETSLTPHCSGLLQCLFPAKECRLSLLCRSSLCSIATELDPPSHGSML